MPSDLTLRLSFVVTLRIRLFPVVGDANFETATERALIEVAHLPFAWLAEIGTPNPDRHSPVVTDWTLHNPADEHALSLTMPLGAITTALPADYRHPWEVTDGSPLQPDKESPGQ